MPKITIENISWHSWLPMTGETLLIHFLLILNMPIPPLSDTKGKTTSDMFVLVCFSSKSQLEFSNIIPSAFEQACQARWSEAYSKNNWPAKLELTSEATQNNFRVI